MKCFVTGGAGFIGSNMADRLLSAGHQVTVYDNLSTGKEDFIRHNLSNPAYKFVKGDMLDTGVLAKSLEYGPDIVFHFAANADVSRGTENTRRDIEQNTIATYNLLEVMRFRGIKKIMFSSTGSVYGEPAEFPTGEDAKFPVQTSFYGAAKSACEGLIEAFVTGFGFQAHIYRFVSILGERYTHGHVFDFYKKLKANPGEIFILGNGKQTKSYLYIQDCIDGVLLGLEKAKDPVNILNLGTEEFCTVDQSLDTITEYLKVNPKRKYAGGIRGWIGDSPLIFLKTDKIKALGWTPKVSIREGVILTLKYLTENSHVSA